MRMCCLHPFRNQRARSGSAAAGRRGSCRCVVQCRTVRQNEQPPAGTDGTRGRGAWTGLDKTGDGSAQRGRGGGAAGRN